MSINEAMPVVEVCRRAADPLNLHSSAATFRGTKVKTLRATDAHRCSGHLGRGRRARDAGGMIVHSLLHSGEVLQADRRIAET